MGGLHYKLRKRAASACEPFPLLLFLHGAGERGAADGSEEFKVQLHGPWKSTGADCCLILAPQCPKGALWPALTEELLEFVDVVVSRHAVDRTRIYGTGLSLGAFGCRELLDRRLVRARVLVTGTGGCPRDLSRDPPRGRDR